MNILPLITPRNWRLRSRLLVVLLVFTLLPLLVVDVLSIRQSSNALTNAIGNEYNNAAQTRAYRIAEVFTEQTRLLKLLSTNSDLLVALRAANSTYPAQSAAARSQIEQTEQRWQTAADTDDLVQLTVDKPLARSLRSFMSLVPGMVDVLVTDKYGGVVASSRRAPHFDMYGQEWWQTSWSNEQGATFLGVGALDRQNEGQGIIFSIPILSTTTDQPIGVLRATYSLSLVQQVLTPYASADLPDTLLVNRANSVVASTNEKSVGQQSPISVDEVNARAHDSANADLFFSVSDLPVIDDLHVISNLGWRVLVVQDSAIAFAPVGAQITSALIAGAMVLLASLSAAFVFGHQLSKPLTQLAGLARAGDLTQIAAQTTRSNGDEVEQLAQSLRELADRVIESQKEIKAVNHGLEQTIAERTATLQDLVDEQETLLLTQRQLLAQIADMSIPVLPVVKDVVVIPLIGSVDSNRAALLAERLLAGVEQERAQVILLDITGVPIVDSQVAAALLQAIYAAQLLGAQTILVGVRPEIAQSMVSLGITMSNVITTATLQEGLQRAATLVRHRTV